MGEKGKFVRGFLFLWSSCSDTRTLHWICLLVLSCCLIVIFLTANSFCCKFLIHVKETIICSCEIWREHDFFLKSKFICNSLSPIIPPPLFGGGVLWACSCLTLELHNYVDAIFLEPLNFKVIDYLLFHREEA